MTAEDGGFTLMEALVGLLILTIGLTALFGAFSGSVGGLRRSEARELAIETARSLIDEAGVTNPLTFGTHEGRSAEGLPWRITIAPHKSSAALRQEPAIDAYWITVTVVDGRVPVSLTTLRIAQ